MQFKPIGIIHSPFKKKADIPIPCWESTAEGKVEVFRQFEQGLQDIEGFSHVILLYLFHKSKGFNLSVKPYLDTQLRGLFATRFPARPNQIGLSTVELLKRDGNVLTIKGIDVLDGTPLLDIKPYIPYFDERKKARTGWMEKVKKTPKESSCCKKQ